MSDKKKLSRRNVRLNLTNFGVFRYNFLSRRYLFLCNIMHVRAFRTSQIDQLCVFQKYVEPQRISFSALLSHPQTSVVFSIHLTLCMRKSTYSLD